MHNKKITYKCIICNFKGLETPPLFNGFGNLETICDCCGTHFGYELIKDDDFKRVEELRQNWLNNDCQIFNTEEFINYYVQLQLNELKAINLN